MPVYHQGKLPACVWDPITDKPIFSFSKRLLETTNPKLVIILDNLGYKQIKAKVGDVVTRDGNILGASTTANKVTKKGPRLQRDIRKQSPMANFGVGISESKSKFKND